MACNVTLGGTSVRIITTDILQIANGSHCLALSPLWERPPEECVCIQRMFADVRFGSKADISARPRQVRFTPIIAESDRHVRFVP
jgi:hypothetical protein